MNTNANRMSCANESSTHVFLFKCLQLQCCIIAIAICTAFYFYFTRNRDFWKERGVTYVKPYSIFGSNPPFHKLSIGHFLYKLYNDYKGEPYVGIFLIDKPKLVPLDLELIKNVMVKDSHLFVDRSLRIDPELDPISAKGLFMMNGQKWKHMRSHLSPTFTTGKMKNMFYLVENCAKGLDSYLESAIADGSPVEVKETMARFTTDIIASCAFGIDSNSLTNPKSEFRAQLRKVFSPPTRLQVVRRLLSVFVPRLLKLLKWRSMDPELMDFLRSTVWNTAKYREEHGIIRKDFLDNLMEMKKKADKDTENDDPNSNSTNVQFDYFLVFMSSYCKNYFSETLRKYPILPFLDRMCTADYKFQSPGKETLIIPAGTGVFIPLMGIQHDPEYYPDPEKFDPERFSEENKQKRPNYTHMPFGDGPRFCVGMRFGLMQTKTGLIHILSHYEVSPCKETPIPLVLTKQAFLLSTRQGIPLNFKKTDMALLGSNILDFVAIVIAICTAFYLYFTRNRDFWKNRGVNLVKIGRNPLFRQLSIGHILHKLYNDYKGEPYIGIFFFGKPILVALDLELVKDVMVKDSQVFIDRTMKLDPDVDPLTARGLFMMKGKKWKHMRNHLSPTFTTGKMKNMYYLVENCSKELDRYLESVIGNGYSVEVKKIMARFTTDVIASCAFGIDSNSLKNPKSEFRAQLRKVFDTPSRLHRWKRLFSALVPGPLKEKHGIVRKDFLDHLMEMKKKADEDIENEDPKSKLENDDYAAQAFTFLTAGFETSSSTMSFALYELSLHPEIQSKLRSEMMQILDKHKQQITYDAVHEIKYLDMVVNETLRKYPILPFLDRMCSEDYKIQAPGKGSITIPAGTGVFIPLMGIHHDPKYYPDPEKFDPERFSEENKLKRPNYTHMPFGDGPRFCIGMRFGLMQTKTGLIHILSRYEVSPCKETPIPLVLNKRSFMLSTKSGIPLNFKKIQTQKLT
ncbi:hypothetical protein C0J52_12805 [Blattella germanica]|nr:hypothetical protein C0J52_12805 [Blattella germanica]